MGNTHVASHIVNTAEVRPCPLISLAMPDGGFKGFSSGTCNASPEERKERWTITRAVLPFGLVKAK